MTNDSSGLCPEHRNATDFFNEGFLKCTNCLVAGCEFKGKGTKGYCYYEVTDKTTDLDEKHKLVESMRRVIACEIRMSSRIERLLTTLSPEAENYTDFLSIMMKINDNLSRHLNMYGAFLGWDTEKSTGSLKKDKMKLLAKIFESDPSETKPKSAEEVINDLEGTGPAIEVPDISSSGESDSRGDPEPQ
jgi:hypothetical protein